MVAQTADREGGVAVEETAVAIVHLHVTVAFFVRKLEPLGIQIMRTMRTVGG